MTVVAAARPCPRCPFRKDVPIYLRRDRRREIARSLADGGEFPCHASVSWEEDDFGDEQVADESQSIICAGAAKALLLQGASTQMMRIVERLGMVDFDQIADAGAEVWGLVEWQEIGEGSTAEDVREDEEEGVEPCSIVGDDCLAPAGYLGANGAISIGTEAADGECSACGEPVCSNCLGDDGLCPYCSENAEKGLK